MKFNRRIMIAGLVALGVCMSAFTVSAQDFTDADATVLKGSDPDAIAEVLEKLVEINEAKGKDAMKPAVPALITCLDNELNIPEDERWNLVEIVKVLSLTGDERARDSFLHVMSVMWGGGNPFTAMAFVNMGKGVVSSVADSLSSKNPDTQGRAALTLFNMDKYDESGSFFDDATRKMVRDKLIKNLSSQEVGVRTYSVIALRAFGDDTVIPKLEFVEKNDAYKDSGGTYEVRIEASKTLEMLKAK